MTKRLVGIVMIMAAVGGCGDSDSDEPPATGDDAATATTAAEPAGDDESPDAAPTTSATEPEDDAADGDDGGNGGDTDILGNPAGTAVVELNDGTRYEFDLTGACQKIFGAVQGAGPLSGGDGDFDAIVPPEDWDTEAQADFEWDPPYVSFDIGDRNWRAEAGLEYFNGTEFVEATPDESSVVSFSNDGADVAGEANFLAIDSSGENQETVSGSFAYGCP